MARIPDQDRLAVVDAHIGHWNQADIQNGTPIEIVPGYGVAQLQADRDAYHAKQEEVAQLDSDLQAARAERNAIFGQDPDDDGGVWFRLKQYKTFVRARLGARHPLSRTVPNLGRIRVERYHAILHAFIDHWERVNAELDPDLTLGTYTLSDLQAAHDAMLAKIQEIEQLEQAQLPLVREEREQLFGDEAEEMRDETSIVARLVLYHATIEAMFPNQPLADSLPEIFPGTGGGGPPLPTFRFNWTDLGGGQLKTWIEDPGLPDASLVQLREGALIETQSFDAAGSGQVVSQTWQNVTVVDELDAMELQDAGGTSVATGQFDSSLPDPG